MTNYSRYYIGYELDPPKGDRPSICVMLTPKQLYEMELARRPPGNEAGQKILTDLYCLKTAAVKVWPNIMFSVCSVQK